MHRDAQIMKKIPLTKGFFALVDDSDYDRLSQFRWIARFFDKEKKTPYAARTVRRPVDGVIRQGAVCMHREIMGLGPNDKMCVDHIDHDTLNNQRANLRLATPSQNGGNTRKLKVKSSHYKGVAWVKSRDRWAAYFHGGGKSKHLGYFDSAEDAARAYNDAAKEFFGEFACLNDVPKDGA